MTGREGPFVQATVVRARRPTSVRPGDSAVVLPDGTIEGFVGGVCAEDSVRLHALRALETGEPLLLRLVPEPGAEEAEEGAVVAHNPCLSGGGLEIFLEPRLPAPRLAVVGDAPVARALSRLGEQLGFAVATEPGGDDAALVVASHGRDEEAALAAALTAGVPYVGLVASARRGAAVRAALDVPDALRSRLHTPAGLSIGARTPEEIALSILAEIVRERREPGPAAPPAPADAAPAPAAVAADGACCHHHGGG
ncbi:MAG: XdhC family protein [Solirubrobacteraceae bacterium]